MPLFNIDDHNLFNEFPEHSERIESLWQDDSQFASAAEEYHVLSKRIRGLEMNGMPVADHYFEELKKRRVQLKDQLYGLIAPRASSVSARR